MAEKEDILDLRGKKDEEIYLIVKEKMVEILKLPREKRSEAIENIRTTYKGWRAILSGVNWQLVDPSEQEKRANPELKELIENGLMSGQKYDDLQLTEQEYFDGIYPRGPEERLDRVVSLYSRVQTSADVLDGRDVEDLTNKEVDEMLVKSSEILRKQLLQVDARYSNDVKRMLLESLISLESKLDETIEQKGKYSKGNQKDKESSDTHEEK